jgi:hypothetical protein
MKKKQKIQCNKIFMIFMYNQMLLLYFSVFETVKMRSRIKSSQTKSHHKEHKEVKKKGKVLPLHSLKAHTGCQGTPPVILILAVDAGGWSTSLPERTLIRTE